MKMVFLFLMVSALLLAGEATDRNQTESERNQTESERNKTESERRVSAIEGLWAGVVNSNARRSESFDELAMAIADLAKTNSDLIHRLMNTSSQLISELTKVNSNLTSELTHMKAEVEHKIAFQNETPIQTRMQNLEAKVRRQVGFHAVGLMNLSESPGDHQPLRIVKNVMYNVGNAYNSTMGDFTAPLPGLYIFMATTGPFVKEDGDVSQELWVDNVEISRAFASNAGDQNVGTAHGVVHMTTGQRAWVKARGNFIYRSRFTMFSGALLSADL